MVSGIEDSRVKEHIPVLNIFLRGMMKFGMRKKSINDFEIEIKKAGRFEKIIGDAKPSGDSIGRIYELIGTEGIREKLKQIDYKVKRKKKLITEIGMRFVSVDGHELFSSRRRCCEKCLVREKEVKGEKIKEYYHRVVICSLIGFEMGIILDAEMMIPGEYEVRCAMRLLERVIRNYSRYFDGIVADGLYGNAPFINFCIGHKKEVMAVLKEENRIIMQDAEGIFKTMEPEIFQEGEKTVKIWDEEGFETIEGVEVGIRVIHAEEEEEKRIKVGNQYAIKKEKENWWWVTTITKKKLSTKIIWQVGHSRWDIENKTFNDLVTNWHMDHCYRHDPTAIINFLLTLFIVFVLMQSFYKYNLKPQMRKIYTTLISIASELLISLASTDWTASWLLPVPDS